MGQHGLYHRLEAALKLPALQESATAEQLKAVRKQQTFSAELVAKRSPSSAAQRVLLANFRCVLPPPPPPTLTVKLQCTRLTSPVLQHVQAGAACCCGVCIHKASRCLLMQASCHADAGQPHATHRHPRLVRLVRRHNRSRRAVLRDAAGMPAIVALRVLA